MRKQLPPAVRERSILKPYKALCVSGYALDDNIATTLTASCAHQWEQPWCTRSLCLIKIGFDADASTMKNENIPK